MSSNKKYFEFYEKIIGFDDFIEIRNFHKNGYINSNYFRNSNDLIKYIIKNRNNINLYCGINPRVEEGRKLSSVSFIKNVVFDIESIGEKSELYEFDEENNVNKDTEYLTKLKKTINFLQDYIFKKFGLNLTCIVTSGRGMHGYITLKTPLDVNAYKNKFQVWYRNLMEYLNKNSPYKNEIKFDVMVKDPTRIFGAPGSVNIKYPEKPVRKILYFNVEDINKNDLVSELNKDKYNIIYNNNNIYSNLNNKNEKNKYKSVFFTPEFLVFKHKPREGTNINNKLRLALKLRMKNNGFNNFEEVTNALIKLGFTYKDMRMNENEYPDYKFNEKILNNYVIENYKWSVTEGFKLPYELKEEKKLKKLIKNKFFFEEQDLNLEFVELKKINNLNDLIEFISEFNKKFKNKNNNKIIYYTKLLERSILNSINDNYLKEFIIFNNLIERLKFYEK